MTVLNDLDIVNGVPASWFIAGLAELIESAFRLING